MICASQGLGGIDTPFSLYYDRLMLSISSHIVSAKPFSSVFNCRREGRNGSGRKLSPPLDKGNLAKWIFSNARCEMLYCTRWATDCLNYLNYVFLFCLFSEYFACLIGSASPKSNSVRRLYILDDIILCD